MGTCIICDTPVDGEVCEFHEEDVCFVFRGSSADQLTPGRYYRGTVDGYADFGVFVDVAPRVTGLLHRSELDQRLESLDWEPGDTVYVQVLDVRDNGNVDLGWSIRQAEREFRGTIIDHPDGDRRPEESEPDDSPTRASDVDSSTPTSGGATGRSHSNESTNESASEPVDATGIADRSRREASGDSTATTASGTAAAGTETVAVDPTKAADAELSRTTVDGLEDQVGAIVRLEGTVTGVRQTSGPTIFELRDETGTVECAAFEEAGVRAYPDVDVDAVISISGEVERHHGDLQVETESIEILEDDDREAVVERQSAAIEREARPASVTPLADHDAVAALTDRIADAATAIRRAVLEGRPIVLRHSDTADGYVAAAAIEHAIVPLVRQKHTRDDAVYHYVERRPLDGHSYGMADATNDVTAMLDARERHDESFPLVVVVDAGATDESVETYEFLAQYGAKSVVVDDSVVTDTVESVVETAVAPETGDGTLTTTAIAATLAAAVNDDVRTDVAHLPALSYWEEPPAAFSELATEAGYDEDALADRRKAVAFEAYYQSYNDKRALIEDLLFDPDGELPAHIAGQFTEKLERELETASENATVHDVDGGTITVLDTGDYTHRFDFPPTALVLDHLHRSERDRTEGSTVTIGIGEDELRLRSTEPIDHDELGDRLADARPDAGVRVVGGTDGHVEFLKGEREAIREAAVETIADLVE